MQHTKRLTILVLSGLLAISLWFIGFCIFLQHIPSEQSLHSQKAQAVVVLTGGSLRLTEGLKLLADGKGEKLLVTGIAPGVDINKMLSLEDSLPPDIEQLKSRIIPGHMADNTKENAEETFNFIESQQYQSFYLVTANYHMPRSLLEFNATFPQSTIYPAPVFPEQFKLDQWWKFPGSASLLLSEYHKYMIAWLRITLGRINLLQEK